MRNSCDNMRRFLVEDNDRKKNACFLNTQFVIVSSGHEASHEAKGKNVLVTRTVASSVGSMMQNIEIIPFTLLRIADGIIVLYYSHKAHIHPTTRSDCSSFWEPILLFYITCLLAMPLPVIPADLDLVCISSK